MQACRHVDVDILMVRVMDSKVRIWGTMDFLFLIILMVISDLALECHFLLAVDRISIYSPVFI